MGYLDGLKGKNGKYTVKNSPNSESIKQLIQESKSKENPIPQTRSYIKVKDLERPDKLDTIPALFIKGIPALHDIRFKISITSNVDIKGIKDIIELKNSRENLAEGEKRKAHITQYQNSTEIIIESSKNPYNLNIAA